MREHAGGRLETALDARGAGLQGFGSGLRFGVGRPPQPKDEPMMLRQMIFQAEQGLQSSAKAGGAVLGVARDDDQPAGPDPAKRLGKPGLVLAAMAAAKHESSVEPAPPRRRPGIMACRPQLEKIWTESLDQLEACREAGRQSKARLGADEQELLALPGRGQPARLEGVEQGFQRVTAHLLPREDERGSSRRGFRFRERSNAPCKKRTGASRQAAPVPSRRISGIRRRALRPLPSSRGRSPCRSSGRRLSSTGGPCRARRSPSA